MKIFSGSSNPQLTNKIAEALDTKVGEVESVFFPNGESRIRIVENVQDEECFIVQPTSDPTNKYIIELCLITDALKRKGAKKVTAIIPWFGYSPQDKVFREGEPLSSEVIIKILESSGVDEFVVVDIHSELILNMFGKKVTHLSVAQEFSKYLNLNFDFSDKSKWLIASIDKGNLARAQEMSKILHIELFQLEKTRDRDSGEVTFEETNTNISGKNILVFDDFTSTGSTLIKSAAMLKNQGAQNFICCVTHMVINSTIEKLQNSSIDRILITNSVNIPVIQEYSKVGVVDISGLLSTTILPSIY